MADISLTRHRGASPDTDTGNYELVISDPSLKHATHAPRQISADEIQCRDGNFYFVDTFALQLFYSLTPVSSEEGSQEGDLE